MKVGQEVYLVEDKMSYLGQRLGMGSFAYWVVSIGEENSFVSREGIACD